MAKVKKTFGERADYAQSAIECIKGADCCIVATAWDEFRQIKPDDFVRYMKTPMVIDGRRIYDPETFGRELKFAAIGLG
jgi:UDPglucose 6-dehydrogenase